MTLRPLLLLLAACGPSDPEVLLDPDGTRDGLDGREGPLGVARASLSVRVRVRDARPVDVIFPADPDGSVRAGPHPVLLFLHDAGAPPDDYTPLAVHLASRGYAVVLPAHRYGQPALEPGNAEAALRVIRHVSRDDGPLHDLTSDEATLAIGGHGAGGVVAAARQAGDEAFDALVLLAAAPGPTPVEEGPGRPVLALAGADDPRVEDVLGGAARFPGPVFAGVVEGDPAWGAPPLGAYRALDAFLDHVLVERRPEPFGGAIEGVDGVLP